MNDVLRELKSVLSNKELPNNDDLKHKFQRLSLHYLISLAEELEFDETRIRFTTGRQTAGEAILSGYTKTGKGIRIELKQVAGKPTFFFRPSTSSGRVCSTNTVFVWSVFPELSGFGEGTNHQEIVDSLRQLIKNQRGATADPPLIFILHRTAG